MRKHKGFIIDSYEVCTDERNSSGYLTEFHTKRYYKIIDPDACKALTGFQTEEEAMACIDSLPDVESHNAVIDAEYTLRLEKFQDFNDDLETRQRIRDDMFKELKDLLRRKINHVWT